MYMPTIEGKRAGIGRKCVYILYGVESMNQTILIVEDNFLNRRLMSDLLMFRGYTVIEAGDGKEGIRKAKEFKPDLIIMDMQMPVMDGFEAMGMLRSDNETGNIGILAITSFAMKGDKERILASGADFYMPKPINTREFLEVVSRLLDERRK